MGASHDANGDLVGYDAAMAFIKNLQWLLPGTHLGVSIPH